MPRNEFNPEQDDSVQLTKKIDAALAKVKEASSVGVPNAIVDGFYAKIEEGAEDAAAAVSTAITNDVGPAPMRSAGGRVEQVTKEAQIHISKEHINRQIKEAKQARQNLQLPPYDGPAEGGPPGEAAS